MSKYSSAYFVRVGALCLVIGWAMSTAQAESWQMQVGDMRVLNVPELARVAVGDGHVLNAVTTEEQEVIVFARNEGSSTVQLWQRNGSSQAYQVEVLSTGVRQSKNELKQLLAKIPGVEISEVGDKLVVEATHLSDRQQAHLAVLAKRYPQLLDLSDSQGWDAMVLLDVQVVEVPRNALRNLGTRWSDTTEGGFTAGLAWERSAGSIGARPGETVVGTDMGSSAVKGYFGINALLSARIHALSEVGAATILAQPQLLARSGSTAEFLAGGEVPYTVTDSNGNNSTQFKAYGVSLRITPLIQSSGAVRSRIEVEVSSIDPSLSVPSGPSLKTRRTATEFNVQSGQTLILAGFISREVARNQDRVPGLGTLPGLGAAFSAERFHRQETELAIFVTPHIVEADHPVMQQRVHRAQAMVAEQFPEAPRLNTVIEHRGNDKTQRPEWALPVQPLSALLQGASHD